MACPAFSFVTFAAARALQTKDAVALNLMEYQLLTSLRNHQRELRRSSQAAQPRLPLCPDYEPVEGLDPRD